MTGSTRVDSMGKIWHRRYSNHRNHSAGCAYRASLDVICSNFRMMRAPQVMCGELILSRCSRVQNSNVCELK